MQQILGEKFGLNRKPMADGGIPSATGTEGPHVIETDRLILRPMVGVAVLNDPMIQSLNESTQPRSGAERVLRE